jgi:uncharacterized protein YlxW (UPF0749 family)
MEKGLGIRIREQLNIVSVKANNLKEKKGAWVLAERQMIHAVDELRQAQKRLSELCQERRLVELDS